MIPQAREIEATPFLVATPGRKLLSGRTRRGAKFYLQEWSTGAVGYGLSGDGFTVIGAGRNRAEAERLLQEAIRERNA